MLTGEKDRARRELEEDLAFVRSELVAETKFSEIVLSEALTLAALGQWSGEFTLLQSPNLSQPLYSILSIARDIAELAARRFGCSPSGIKSPPLIPDDLPAEEWADRVISSIETDAATFRLDRTVAPAIGWQLRVPSANTLAWQRRVGKLGEAHRTSDQVLALARRLSQTYPDQAAGYMLLSDAYVQKAKIAYREEEAPVIMQWEQKAFDAAVRAVVVEPENGEAGELLKNRLIRLHKIRQSGDFKSAWLHRPR
jgi:hypothetical protein